MVVNVVAASPVPPASGLPTALIAGAAGLAGVVVTAITSIIVAQYRTREIRLTYEQKLQDSYLENARAYTNSVYAPLGVQLHSLSSAYRRLQASSYSEAELCGFRRSCSKFLSGIEGLMNAAAGVFLTAELEQALEEFEGFVRDSINATETKRHRVLVVNESSILVSVSSDVGLAMSQIALTFSTLILPIKPRAQFFVRRSKVLYAPLHSDEFEERLVSDLANLRRLVKEVTLGATARAG